MKEKKVSVSEAILVLEMIRLDLIKQVSDSAYTKKPVEIVKKEADSGRVRKDNS